MNISRHWRITKTKSGITLVIAVAPAAKRGTRSALRQISAILISACETATPVLPKIDFPWIKRRKRRRTFRLTKTTMVCAIVSKRKATLARGHRYYWKAEHPNG